MKDVDIKVTDEQMTEIERIIESGKSPYYYVKTLLPASIVLGYGFYEVNSVRTIGDEHFVNIEIGSSCD